MANLLTSFAATQRPILSRQAFLNQLGSPVRRSPRGHNSPVYTNATNAFPLVGEPPVSPTSGRSSRRANGGGADDNGLARSLFATSPPRAASTAPQNSLDVTMQEPVPSSSNVDAYPPAAIAYLRDLLGKQNRAEGPPPQSPRLMYDRIMGLANLRGPVEVGSADEVQRRSAKHLVNTMRDLGLIPAQALRDESREDEDVTMSTSPREMSVDNGAMQRPSLAPVAQPASTAASGTKRKRTASATPSASGSSAVVGPGVANIPITVYEIRDPADAHVRDKRKKQQWKWDQDGCENCGVQKSSCWMQRRRRGTEQEEEELSMTTADKLCYSAFPSSQLPLFADARTDLSPRVTDTLACGQYWNKNGSHRPIKAKRLPTKQLQPPAQMHDGTDKPSPAGSGSGSNSGTPSASDTLASLPLFAPKPASSHSFPPRPFKSVLSLAAERESQILQRNLARRAHRLEASGRPSLLPPPTTSPSGKCDGRFAGVRPKPVPASAQQPLSQPPAINKTKRSLLPKSVLGPQGTMTSPPRGATARGRQMSLPPGGVGGVSVTSPIRGNAGEQGSRSPGKSGFAAGTAGGYASEGDEMSWFDSLGGGTFDGAAASGSGNVDIGSMDIAGLLDLDLSAFGRDRGQAGLDDPIANMSAADLFNSLDFNAFNPPSSTSPATSIAASANALAAVVGDGFIAEPSKKPTPERSASSSSQGQIASDANLGLPPTTASRTTGSTHVPSIFSSSFANHAARRAFTSDVGTSPSIALAKSAKRRKTDSGPLSNSHSLTADADNGAKALASSSSTTGYREQTVQELMDGFDFDPTALDASFALDDLLSSYTTTTGAPSAPSMTSQESEGPSSSAASHSSGATVVNAPEAMFSDRMLGPGKRSKGVINSGLSSAIRTRLQPFSRHSSSDRLMSDASSMMQPSSPPLPPPSDCSEGITPLSERNGDRPTDTDGEMADVELEDAEEEEEDFTARMQYDIGRQSSSTDDLAKAANHNLKGGSGSNLSHPPLVLGPDATGLPPEILAAMSGALEAGWTTDALAEALKAVSEGGADALMASLGLQTTGGEHKGSGQQQDQMVHQTTAAGGGQGEMDVFEALFNGSASP